MNGSWIIQSLQDALDTWNGKLAEIWQLMTLPPQEFRGGSVWAVIASIHDVLKAVGYALLVLFFAAGAVRAGATLADTKRPEPVIRMFLRFALAKAGITYGMDIMLGIMSAVQGVIRSIMEASGFDGTADMALPAEVADAVAKSGFFESIPLWCISLIGSLFMLVESFVLIFSVYGRFFRIYMFTAAAPIPLASFAGEQTSQMGKSFLRNYTAACLEGAVIVLACAIFSAYASSPPQISEGMQPVAAVWSYITQTAFNMLVLTGAVRISDRVAREISGL